MSFQEETAHDYLSSFEQITTFEGAVEKGRHIYKWVEVGTLINRQGHEIRNPDLRYEDINNIRGKTGEAGSFTIGTGAGVLLWVAKLVGKFEG